MRKFILTTLALLGLGLAAHAQTVTTPPIQAMACAYSTSLPTLLTGSFGLVQCDSHGQLLISGGGGGGGGPITAPLGTNTIAASVSVTPATSSLWPVSAASLPLPNGAATAALQTTINTTLGSPMQNSGGTVGISGSLPATADTVGTSGALGSLNAHVDIAINGQQGVSMQLSAGNLIGTLIPQISFDGGSTWINGYFYDPSAITTYPSLTFASANTITQLSIPVTGGTSNVRVKVNVYTSGTATAVLRATTANLNEPLAAQGSTTAGQIGFLGLGAVTTSAPTYSPGQSNPTSLKTNGSLRVDATDGAIQAFSTGSAPSGANNVMVGLLDSSGNAANGTLIGAQGTALEAQPSDNITASTAVGTGGSISVATEGERGAVFQLQAAGTGIYTVTPQCSYDGGISYNTNGSIIDPISGATSLTATIASAQAETNYPVLCPSGTSNIQMKVTAFTSGTANWLARATTLSPTEVIYGSDGTNIRAIATGTNGELKVTPDVMGATSTAISGTVTTGGTFQSILAASGTRKGCLIQNPITATETLFVFFGANGSALTTNSINLPAGGAVSCNTPGPVLQDNISVTATTTGHAFVAFSQ